MICKACGFDLATCHRWRKCPAAKKRVYKASVAKVEHHEIGRPRAPLRKAKR